MSDRVTGLVKIGLGGKSRIVLVISGKLTRTVAETLLLDIDRCVKQAGLEINKFEVTPIGKQG